MFKKSHFLIFCICLTACAATYEKPKITAQEVSATISGDRAAIMRAAKRVLVSEGYQVTTADDSAGIISTAPRDIRLIPQQADCGTTMGIDYLKDNRTATRVAIGIIADNGRVEVKSTIQGEYRPGAVDQDITLTCVSRGAIEQVLLNKISTNVGR